MGFWQPHPGHENHLCAKVSAGTDLDEYKQLVKDPKFLCAICGRAAASKDNLCNPVPIE